MPRAAVAGKACTRRPRWASRSTRSAKGPVLRGNPPLEAGPGKGPGLFCLGLGRGSGEGSSVVKQGELSIVGRTLAADTAIAGHVCARMQAWLAGQDFATNPSRYLAPPGS
jgi:hypothetical protein